MDCAGNIRRLRAAGGADLGGYRYSAFGKTLEDTTTVVQPHRWKGRWASDVAGGIYDVRARQWSPNLGAFLSIDEFAFHDASSTLWGWPGQNPIVFADPDGRGTLGAILGGGAGAGIGVGAAFATSGLRVAGGALFGAELGTAGGPPGTAFGAAEGATVSLTVGGAALIATGAIGGAILGNAIEERGLGILEARGPGKAEGKANQDRVEAAAAELERLRRELGNAEMKPNKTPDDDDLIKRLRKAIKKQLARLRKSETHGRRGQGYRGMMPGQPDDDDECP
jgi:RHS repeat-associated protein